MTGILQVRVSKAGLPVYPEVYIVAIDVTGASPFGDLVPYNEDRLYELGVGWWTIRARNNVTGEILEKDLEIFEGETTITEFVFGVAVVEAHEALPYILAEVGTGLGLIVMGSLVWK